MVQPVEYLAAFVVCAPGQSLVVLDPLEVGGDDPAAVGEQVGDDGDAAVVQAGFGAGHGRSVGCLDHEFGLEPLSDRRPALGSAGVWFTVTLAIVATASGVMASVFAASRMLAMLTRMTQVPHRHFGMPGTVRTHTTVYTVAFAMALAATLDLRRIAALGAVYYLIMDIAIQWGLLRKLRDRVDFRPGIVITAIILDTAVLAAFLWVTTSTDPLGLWVAAAGIVLIVVGERLLMASHTRPDGTMDM